MGGFRQRALTCHTNGRLFRFIRTIITAAILEYFPGPVKVRVRSLLRFALDAPAPKTIRRVKPMDFKGRRVAEAMVKE